MLIFWIVFFTQFAGKYQRFMAVANVA